MNVTGTLGERMGRSRRRGWGARDRVWWGSFWGVYRPFREKFEFLLQMVCFDKF